jgi:hypothetical protein
MPALIATTRIKANVASYSSGGPSAFFAFSLFAFAFSSFFWFPRSKQTDHLLKKHKYYGG